MSASSESLQHVQDTSKALCEDLEFDIHQLMYSDMDLRAVKISQSRGLATWPFEPPYNHGLEIQRLQLSSVNRRALDQAQEYGHRWLNLTNLDSVSDFVNGTSHAQQALRPSRQVRVCVCEIDVHDDAQREPRVDEKITRQALAMASCIERVVFIVLCRLTEQHVKDGFSERLLKQHWLYKLMQNCSAFVARNPKGCLVTYQLWLKVGAGIREVVFGLDRHQTRRLLLRRRDLRLQSSQVWEDRGRKGSWTNLLDQQRELNHSKRMEFHLNVQAFDFEAKPGTIINLADVFAYLPKLEILCIRHTMGSQFGLVLLENSDHPLKVLRLLGCLSPDLAFLEHLPKLVELELRMPMGSDEPLQSTSLASIAASPVRSHLRHLTVSGSRTNRSATANEHSNTLKRMLLRSLFDTYFDSLISLSIVSISGLVTRTLRSARWSLPRLQIAFIVLSDDYFSEFSFTKESPWLSEGEPLVQRILLLKSHAVIQIESQPNEAWSKFKSFVLTSEGLRSYDRERVRFKTLTP